MKSLVVGVVLLLVAAAFLPKVRRKMSDFEVGWRSGTRWMAAEPLYRAEDGHYQYKYLPVFGGAIAPLARLPLGTAKAVWFFVLVAAIFGAVAMSLALLPQPKRPPWLLALATAALMAKFFAHEVNLGQFNAVMLVLVLGGFLLIERRRPLLGGAVIAASVVIKPYPVLFLPYLLFTGRRKAATAGVICLGLALAAPAAVYGWAGNRALLEAWARTVSDSTAPNLLNQDNVSIWAMYAKWLGIGPLAARLASGTIAVLGVFFLAVWARGAAVPRAAYLEMAAILMLIPLCSPQGWDYVLLTSTPAVALLVNELPDLPIPARLPIGAALALMAFSVFDLMGRHAYGVFMSLSSITLCALVLLGSLGYLRFKRLA